MARVKLQVGLVAPGLGRSKANAPFGGRMSIFCLSNLGSCDFDIIFAPYCSHPEQLSCYLSHVSTSVVGHSAKLEFDKILIKDFKKKEGDLTQFSIFEIVG